MSTKAHEFLRTYVAPSFNYFAASPLDFRKAMAAAIYLNQLADYFWLSYHKTDPVLIFHTKNIGSFRSELNNRCPEFGIVRDVAEAHKHMELDRSPRVVTKSEQASVESTGWGIAGYGTGPWGGGPSIVVELNNGNQVHFSFVAKRVFNLWQRMLA